MEQEKWIRYRFYTKSVDDYRPLIFNPKYPWWCSGFSWGGEPKSATIVAFLPAGEDLKKYWDDAYDIESEIKDSIEFSGRFPQPAYFKPKNQ